MLCKCYQTDKLMITFDGNAVDSCRRQMTDNSVGPILSQQLIKASRLMYHPRRCHVTSFAHLVACNKQSHLHTRSVFKAFIYLPSSKFFPLPSLFPFLSSLSFPSLLSFTSPPLSSCPYPFPYPFHFPPLLFHSLPLPSLKAGPLNPARESGGAL